MKRLPARSPAPSLLMLLVSHLSLAACTEEQKTAAAPSKGRTEVVLAKEGASVASTPPPPASTEHAAPKVPRRICEAELGKPGRAVPRATFDSAAAPGVTPPSSKLDVGAGRWTWINFFAAWCGPCKEEMPRLRGWEQKLSSLRVRFVSLDDDERQLGRFLEGQPAAGVKGSLWLKPGPSRDGFLTGLKLKSSPSLPAHALVDPDGRVRCAFEGAVDESDYPQVESIVARR